jgi:hypothetical protein
MKDQILSPEAFRWFLTLIVGIVAAAWFVYDSINLLRTRHLDRNDPIVRDKHFGYVMGMLIGIVGVYGCLRYQGIA